LRAPGNVLIRARRVDTGAERRPTALLMCYYSRPRTTFICLFHAAPYSRFLPPDAAPQKRTNQKANTRFAATQLTPTVPNIRPNVSNSFLQKFKKNIFV
jgi:hypothetical protein